MGRRARPVRLSENAPAAGAHRSHTTCRFPFNVRRTLGGWKFLFLDGKPFTPDQTRTPLGIAALTSSTAPATAPNAIRRAYILGGIMPASASPEVLNRAATLCAEHHPEGSSMSHEELVKLLETGETTGWHTSRRDGQVVTNTGKLSAADRAAIATYVKSLPPVVGPKPPESK